MRAGSNARSNCSPWRTRWAESVRSRFRLQAPAVDPPGMDTDHLFAHVRAQLVRPDQEFRLAADVDAPYLPGADADDVVHDQCDLRVLPQVAPLLGRAHRIAADEDRPVGLGEEA